MRAAREGGWPVTQVLAYDQVFGKEARELKRHLTKGKFQLLWADLPGRRGDERGQRPQQRLRSLAESVRAQVAGGGAVMLVAERGSAMWADPTVLRLRAEVPHEVDIHWCSLNVQSIPDEAGERGWSDRVDRVQSSFQIRARPCTCQGQERRHKNDWKGSSGSDIRRQQREKQHSQYLVAMFREISDALVTEGNRLPPESSEKQL